MAVKVRTYISEIRAIQRGPAMLALLEEKGQAVKERAEETAPDARQLREGYIDAFEVHVGIVAGEPVCRVVNQDFKAWWVEHGARAGGKTPVLNYRTLGRALEAARG